MTGPTEKWRRNFQDLKIQLLRTGVLDEHELFEVRRDISPTATSTWAQRQGTRILAVETAHGRVYPALQFTQAGDLRPELTSTCAILQDAGLSAWMTWAWLTSPTTLLSGAVPARVLVEDPARGTSAVRRYAERVREEGSGTST